MVQILAERDGDVPGAAIARDQIAGAGADMGVSGPADLHFEAGAEAVADQQIAGGHIVLAVATLPGQRPIAEPKLDRDMAGVHRAGWRAETGPVRAEVAQLLRVRGPACEQQRQGSQDGASEPPHGRPPPPADRA